MVFSWAMAWEVGGRDVRDCFGIDTHCLENGIHVSQNFTRRLDYPLSGDPVPSATGLCLVP